MENGNKILIIFTFSILLIFNFKVFFNWKNQLRTRAKKLKQIQDGKTGPDDKLALQKLTDVEKRALKLWKEDFQDKDIASVSENIYRRFFVLSHLSFVFISTPFANTQKNEEKNRSGSAVCFI